MLSASYQGWINMSFLGKKIGPFSMFQFIGIVGAILVIVSFFLAWGQSDTVIIGVENYTGMDFFDKKVLFADGDAWQNMIPLMALVLAIIALIISVVPGEYLGGEKTEKILGIVSIAAAVVLLVLSVMFMSWFGDYLVDTTVLTIKYGIGMYLCLVGSILVFVVGILPLFKR